MSGTSRKVDDATQQEKEEIKDYFETCMISCTKHARIRNHNVIKGTEVCKNACFLLTAQMMEQKLGLFGIES